jgi:hypothetical protein
MIEDVAAVTLKARKVNETVGQGLSEPRIASGVFGGVGVVFGV